MVKHNEHIREKVIAEQIQLVASVRRYGHISANDNNIFIVV